MKRFALLFILAISFTCVFSQESMYKTAMKANIDSLLNTSSIEQYSQVANKFEIIANKEKEKWLPLYYLSLTKVFMSFNEKNDTKRDLYLDEAQKHLDKAMILNKNESELLVLQGFIYQARISVSPMVRGYKYSTLANQIFDKATELNPDNPRIYYLKAMNILNTPSMFGGGKKSALPLFKKAKEKYDSFVPKNELYPNWGVEKNAQKIAYCNK